MQWRFTVNGVNTPGLVYVLDPVGNPFPNAAGQTRTVTFHFPTTGLTAGDLIGVSARINSNLVGWTVPIAYPFHC